MAHPPATSLADAVLGVLKKASDTQGKVPLMMLEKVLKELNWGQNTSGLRKELEEIAAKLSEATAETKNLVPDENLANAAQELNAAMQHSENAANEIMDAAEAIMGMTQDATIQGKLMDIITACNFQDLSGQRIKKVARVLGHIEPRIRRLISLLVQEEQLPPHLSQTTLPGDDSHLMNGPQLPGQESSQADIDRLFNEN